MEVKVSLLKDLNCFRKLQCARNRLHLHLFISFSMRAFTAILKDFLFLKGVAMSSNLVLFEGEMFIRGPSVRIILIK